MNNNTIELDLKDFFNFLYQKKRVILSIFFVCMAVGIIKCTFITRKETASVVLLPPTIRDISILNYERTSATKVKAISSLEVYNIYSAVALSVISKNLLMQDFSGKGIELETVQGPGYRLKVTVAAKSTDLAVSALKKFLLNTKAAAVEKIQELSDKSVKYAKANTEKEIEYYKKLADEALASARLADNGIVDKANALMAISAGTDVGKQLKLAQEYEKIVERYTLELATMRPLPLDMEQLDVYLIDHQILVQQQSPWPKRLQFFGALLILSMIFSLMLLLLLFLYQTGMVKQDSAK